MEPTTVRGWEVEVYPDPYCDKILIRFRKPMVTDSIYATGIKGIILEISESALENIAYELCEGAAYPIKRIQ